MTTKQETTFPFNATITGNDALFNDYSLMTHPLLPSTSTPQDLSQLLQLDSNQPFVIDDWLATELHQSGLLPPTSSGSSTSSGASSPELPNSPPLTASPPSSKESTSPSSVYHLQQQQQQPCVPLFPEIAPKQQQQQQRRLVPIMPKTEMIAAAAAAAMSSGHDSSMGATTPVLSVPSHGNNKRKASCDKDREDIVLKRQRNTDAARRSRLKKLLKMEALEKRVNELEGENTRLTTRVAVLESEKSGLENKDKDLQERIRVLEEQLAEAHKALTSKCSH